MRQMEKRFKLVLWWLVLLGICYHISGVIAYIDANIGVHHKHYGLESEEVDAQRSASSDRTSYGMQSAYGGGSDPNYGSGNGDGYGRGEGGGGNYGGGSGGGFGSGGGGGFGGGGGCGGCGGTGFGGGGPGMGNGGHGGGGGGSNYGTGYGHPGPGHGYIPSSRKEATRVKTDVQH